MTIHRRIHSEWLARDYPSLYGRLVENSFRVERRHGLDSREGSRVGARETRNPKWSGYIGEITWHLM